MISFPPSNGPLWHAAEFFFLYAGIFGDTVFVRISLILAQILIFAWITLGCPEWPDVMSPNSDPIFHLDAFLWCSLCVVVAAIPLYHQLTHNDARTCLDCGPMTDMAEAMWRDWFRRSGIPRSEFKKILDAGEWFELSPGEIVPMAFADSTVYYYVVGGCVDCRARYKEGDRFFERRHGSFLDAFDLMGFLGQPTAALAMQLSPMEAQVDLNSTYSLKVPTVNSDTSLSSRRLGTPLLRRSSSAAELEKRGALLIRWQKTALLEGVMCSGGLALSAFRLIVTQSTLDNVFSEVIASKTNMRRRYDVIHDMRQRLNDAPLPVDAASPKRRMGMQWWLAHVSMREFWRPGQEQRAMNAITLDNQEKRQMEDLRVHEEELERLRDVATPLQTPCQSSDNLVGLDNTMKPTLSTASMSAFNSMYSLEESLSRQSSMQESGTDRC